MKRTMMGRAKLLLLAVAVITASRSVLAQSPQDSVQDNVLTYHGSPDRKGNFVVPGLTWQRARSLHVDEKFRAHVAGNVYAQPLHWRTAGSSSGVLLVASEDNNVHALDATTGNAIWTRSLGKPVAPSALRCGNISPLGITGTPVIDEASAAIYLDANIADASGPRHRLFALSLKDGSVMPGWPIDVTDALRSIGQSFNSPDRSSRL